jgi:hypothetical protein
MGNLSISWLVIWPQVTNINIICLGDNEFMCNTIKAKKLGLRLQPLICWVASWPNMLMVFFFFFCLGAKSRP